MKTGGKYRGIKAAGIGAGALLLIYTGLSIYGATAAMPLERLPLNPDVTPASLGLDYENVAFRSREDNVLLKGWYLPARGETAIIIVHGGEQNRVDDNVDTLELARDMVGKGYDILLFDLRGRGESEGKGLALSNIEKDIGGAADYLKSRGYPMGRIGIMGFCSGAASASIFASQNSPGALILVGCFARVRRMVGREAEDYGIPGVFVNIFAPGVLLASEAIYRFQPVDPVDVIADIDCPIFFIHEENDEYISRGEMEGLYRKTNQPGSQFWEVKDTLHSQAYKTNPAEFIEKVNGFLCAAMEKNQQK
jgi:pimeloyl-ACP methyl ester carboxylesterase